MNKKVIIKSLNFFLFIISSALYCSYTTANSFLSCLEPIPPSPKQINALEKALFKFDPSNKGTIKEINICSYHNKKSALIDFFPHITKDPVIVKHTITCYKDMQEPWYCTEKNIIKTYKGVIVSSNLTTDEIERVFSFIKKLNTNDFYDYTKKYPLKITKKVIDSYRKVSSIEKNNNGISVITPYGEYGCFLYIEQIQCGLDLCDFKVVATGTPLCGGCGYNDKEYVKL